jgi:hypothetical protein
MVLEEKVTKALHRSIQDARVFLIDNDGISGFVVSTHFRGMPAIDRQTVIDKALRDPAVKLSKGELRRVLAIAALTPAEYESVDPGLRGDPR